jgi:EAL domain-containing protein (putative c-di-GMP-specific phosphodiesterase class I)
MKYENEGDAFAAARGTAVSSDDVAAPKGRVLIVDDEASVARGYARVLRADGFAVELAHNGADAIASVKRGGCDVIVSDLTMPGMDGMQLLRAVRDHDLDVPVVIVTGMPAVESAIAAVEYGALRYLTKPVTAPALLQVVLTAVNLHRMAVLKREALAVIGEPDKVVGEHAGLEARFARALDGIWIAYQPIVCWSRREIYGYEALLRSTEPSLPNPLAVIDAAERLGRVHDLGRVARRGAVAPFARLPPNASLFLNLHPHDLSDDQLDVAETELSAVAGRVVLEVTERASLHHIKDVPARIAALRARGFRIAIDDLGAGYAGLNTFALLEPEVVKIDMALVRDIDSTPTKQSIVRSVTTLCRDLGMLCVAEGIETAAERDTLVAIGLDLFQGYLFARPDRPFPSPRW